MKTQAFLVAAVALTMVASCSSDDDSTSDEVADLCTDMEALQSTVESVAGASFDPATTTKNSVEEQLGTLQTQVEAVQSESADVSESVKSSLQESFDTYVSTLEGIPGDGDTTLDAATEELLQAKETFYQSWNATLSELDCAPAPTTT